MQAAHIKSAVKLCTPHASSSFCFVTSTTTDPISNSDSAMQKLLPVFLIGAVVLFSLQMQSSGQPFSITFRRTGDVITLSCRDEDTGTDIDVEVNNSILFNVNLTKGDRIGSANLSERLSPRTLMRTGTGATFTITRELGGFYSCGTSDGAQSNTQPLICK